MKNIRILSLLLLSIVLFNCSTEGLDGTNGINGVNGINGINGLDGINGSDGASIGMTVNVLANGCSELIFYLDANNNQTNDNETIISTLNICNGEDASQVGPQGEQGEQGEQGGQGEQGEQGEQGLTGPDGQSVGIYIEQASLDDCTNSGFIVYVFNDNNNDSIYNGDDTIVSSNIICYPDAESIDFPDYSELGHTFEAIGIWRLYSIEGIPVQEENRFNIKIYPDSLNPNLLNGNTNDSGWLDFYNTTKIPWVLKKNYTTSVGFIIDESEIEGLVTDFNSEQNLQYFFSSSVTNAAEFIRFHYPVNLTEEFYDMDIWGFLESEGEGTGLRNCVFIRIQ